ncbi:MAG: isoamylase early set domain-containing protein, partial [Anaerolineae bacterium]|nr:isoamylase early set domain-containing protein [Anaerolineae bacterium]
MIQKTTQRKGAQIKVEFELPANGAQSAAVVGDFNAWQPDALPMKLRKKDGVFSASTTLEAGQTYQFRYLVDGQGWVTDPEADGVAMSPFGEP